MAYVPNSGSVVAFQSDPTKLVGTFSVVGTLPVIQSGTVISSISGGISSVALAGANTVSVVGTIGASLIGLSPINIVGAPSIYGNVSGSVVSFQGGAWTQSVVGNVGQIGTIISSISGGIIASISGGISSVALAGANTVSVVGQIGASIVGTVPVVQSGTMITSIAGIPNVTGSVVGVRTYTSSVYAVLSSITTVSVMNLNLNRLGGTIYNSAGTTVYLKLGTAATTSVYTVQMNNNDYYELPAGYTGVVAGITTSNAGIINVTELL